MGIPWKIAMAGALLLAFVSAQGQSQAQPETQAPAAPPAAATQAANAASPVESPQAAYDRAMQPVEIVRRSPNNVTDAEMGAWGVAVVAAAHECAGRKLEDYSGEDLFHYARLCLLGQQHDLAAEAAAKYVKDGNSTSVESARGLIVRAWLSMGNLIHADRGARDLMQHHAYDGTVHTLIQETITALAAKDAVEPALQLDQSRHEALLAALRSPEELRTHDGSYRIPVPTLVRDALSAVYLYRLQGREREAASLLTSVAEAVRQRPGTTAVLERAAIESALRRAQMLGSTAPTIAIGAADMAQPASEKIGLRPKPVATKPVVEQAPGEIHYRNKVTVLAFYAPWLPQRSKLLSLLAEMGQQYKTLGLQVFAISTPAAVTGNQAAKPVEVLAALMEQNGKPAPALPVLVVADSVAQQFAIDDYPMLAVVDGNGMLRFLDLPAGSELSDGGRMHRLVAGIVSKQVESQPAPKAGPVKVPAEKLERKQ